MKKFFALFVAVFALVAFTSTNVLASGGAPKAFGKCKACHKIKNDNTKWTVGPGLKGVGSRLSAEYLAKWLKDPQGTFDEGGPEVDALKAGKKFKKKLKMPKIVKKLSDEDIAKLVTYLGTL